MSPALHIASLIIHTKPDQRTDVEAWLAGWENTEVRAQDASGKLVVVTEATDEQRILDLIDQAQNQPAVLSAALVYHEIMDSDTADELEEAAS